MWWFLFIWLFSQNEKGLLWQRLHPVWLRSQSSQWHQNPTGGGPDSRMSGRLPLNSESGKAPLPEGRQLLVVPGVNVQVEDGFGLRWNVGLRGTPPWRSRYVSFFEDGTPGAAAPLSAPSQYYVPHLWRFDSIEVEKSFKSVLFFPNNRGGGIILKTLNLEDDTLPSGQMLFQVGSFNGTRLNGRWYRGDENLRWALFFDGIRSDGFYRIENVPKSWTGFHKEDIFIKGRYQPSGSQSWWQWSLGVTQEKSAESYLGQTWTDFKNDPWRRYSASQTDHFRWIRWRWQLDWSINPSLVMQAYQGDFDRYWARVDHLKDMRDPDQVLPNIWQILRSPQVNQIEYRVLRGLVNSSDVGIWVMKALNQRYLWQQGVRVAGQFHLKGGDLQGGWIFQWHQDQIQRKHDVLPGQMQSGVWIPVGASQPALRNKDQGEGYLGGLWIQGDFWRDWRWSVAASYQRVMLIHQRGSGNRWVHPYDLTRIGGQWSRTLGKGHEFWVALYNSHQLPNPGVFRQPPEVAWNGEWGWQWKRQNFFAEGVIFGSKIRNVLGVCSSQEGCLPAQFTDLSFSAPGDSFVWGVEGAVGGRWVTRWGIWKWRSALTGTQARFGLGFVSQNPEWGLGYVPAGSPWPYVPDWQVSHQMAWVRKNFEVGFNLQGQTGSWDSVAQEPDRVWLPGFVWLDSYVLWQKGSQTWQMRVDNVFGNTPVVTFRPMGARSLRPRLFWLSWQKTF